jgi:hypothetical protein
MIKTVDDYGTEGIQVDIFDYGVPLIEEKDGETMKRFYYKCKKVHSNEIKEISVLAKNIKQAEEILASHKDEWIPLEYVGWTE